MWRATFLFAAATTCIALGGLYATLDAHAQSVTVSLHVALLPQGRMPPAKKDLPSESGRVIAWLRPLGSSPLNAPTASVPTHNFVLTQKNKQFTPHLLVVPTGSSVEFPNLDPFFHNVFSLFDGRRFDLGLYEAGSRRSVRFDHEGVSYIFCNIHPQMGAVVISLSTPYYGVSQKDGSVLLVNVPPGDYELNLWSENVSTNDLAAAKQRLRVRMQNLDLPPISLAETASSLDRHLNKFNEPYAAPLENPYQQDR